MTNHEKFKLLNVRKLLVLVMLNWLIGLENLKIQTFIFTGNWENHIYSILADKVGRIDPVIYL